jgi:hypothetical protein
MRVRLKLVPDLARRRGASAFLRYRRKWLKNEEDRQQADEKFLECGTVCLHVVVCRPKMSVSQHIVLRQTASNKICFEAMSFVSLVLLSEDGLVGTVIFAGLLVSPVQPRHGTRGRKTCAGLGDQMWSNVERCRLLAADVY